MKRIMLAIAVVAALSVYVPGAVAADDESPFERARFSHPLTINNPYLPLRAGQTYIYRGTTDNTPTYEQFVVTYATQIVSGVRARVVHDRNWEGGELVEDTYDWYAQDDAGNVWYLGEFSTQYENGKVAGHEGSWRAGTNDASAGIAMEAHPQVGDSYAQEFSVGIAEDRAAVLSLTRSVCVPYGCFSHVLQTKETTRLEPGVVEYKFYARGIGEIKAFLAKGGSEESHLVRIVTK